MPRYWIGRGLLTIHPKDFRVAKRGAIDLAKRPTRIDPFFSSAAHYADILAVHLAKLGALQQLLYASSNYAILLIVQGMDAAGKDGTIQHVMSGVSPQGCQAFNFRQPSAEELKHDFLWRTTLDLPERGRIGIFNRSYYEEVLVVRVHRDILKAEDIPDAPHNDAKVWKDRYRSIVDYERHLHANGTRVVKIFLHLSKDEQRKRFLARIDEPHNNWKFNPADIEERKFWKGYQEAYQACISSTSTHDSPWYIVPADDKDNARLIVSQIVVDTLEALKERFPTPTPERVALLQSIRAKLDAEA